MLNVFDGKIKGEVGISFVGGEVDLRWEHILKVRTTQGTLEHDEVVSSVFRNRRKDDVGNAVERGREERRVWCLCRINYGSE